MAIAEGDTIPAVELLDGDGTAFRLDRFLGAPLVLYFYPKDDTAGCTREAQEFSAARPAFDAAGAQLLGVSKDSPARHRKFTAKYDLTVPLATDPDGAVIEAFGAWVEKTLYGKKYMGIDRSTFLFDAGGQLVRVWRKVKVPGHVDQVLAAVKELG
ncbi:peroxiredoxin [Sphingomonas turrisvirgatae]|uniref:thioredoxin-dependent peroxiredoxin n=1 Tax=Sphingomonas turrisvirgatae TaxID=1888892 RepID=A0A1E3LY71_9SPHN|nr:peroxiredoxin [Sphingomonas turrisvirgatae]ODP38736.1 peroxiredoxin [Sphingomonas turrisvirgatae]